MEDSLTPLPSPLPLIRMDQLRSSLQQRELLSLRENGWHAEGPLHTSSQEGSFTAESIYPRCLVGSQHAMSRGHALRLFKPVETALKYCAGLSVKEFALIIRGEHGEEKTYTSASLTPHQQRIFTHNFRVDFRRITENASPGGSYLSLGLLIDSASAIQILANVLF